MRWPTTTIIIIIIIIIIITITAMKNNFVGTTVQYGPGPDN